MNKKHIENTLFLGNGFSQTIFKDIPSWDGLFTGVSVPIKNNTFLYEAYRLLADNAHSEEAVIKNQLLAKINVPFSETSIRDEISDLEKFGSHLIHNNINNIITTNYDTGIEFILGRCGYSEEKASGLTPERVYNIRTFKVYYNANTQHRVKLWKIHGDVDRIASITLGFDQYCGSLAKLTDYIKGNYNSSQNAESAKCDKHMQDKCNNGSFDGLSWAELFFNTNLYIVGFGMNFSEIDIWWLINKRARFKIDGVKINNTITYIYNPLFEDRATKPALFATLDAFDVSCKPLKGNASYIEEIFSNI